ncbi:hypothetical protein Q8F55_006323 [Vanrija albida]|uniref:Peptidase A1 domain-containing protein n=1 Tax=Vanrija albida TaxID=181172 RepID=A0ABR3PWT7_9TREE
MSSMSVATVSALVLALATLAVPTQAVPLSADGGPVHLELSAPRRSVPSLQHVADRRSKRDNTDPFNANLVNWFDSAYAVNVAFGTPPQDFVLFLETQSPLTWVYDSSCTPDTCKGQTGGFDTSKSSTYVANDTLNSRPQGPPSVQLSDDLFLNGTWGSDTVSVDGAEGKSASVDNFMFMNCKLGGIINNSTQRPAGGLGLGWPSPGSFSPPTMLSKLAEGWKDKRFAIHLAQQPAPADGLLEPQDSKGGTLTLGGVNSALFTGEIDYVPLSTRFAENGAPTFWEITVDAADYGGKQYGNDTGNGTIASVDAVSTSSSVPDKLFHDVYSNISDARLVEASGDTPQYYTFPCASSGQVKPLTLTLGGKEIVIPAEALYTPYEAVLSTKEPAGWCMGLLQTMGEPSFDNVDWLFGVPFLRNLYTVFQLEPPAIGFAKLSASASKGSHCRRRRA